MNGICPAIAIGLLLTGCTRELPNPDQAEIDAIRQISRVSLSQNTRIIEKTETTNQHAVCREWTLVSTSEITLPIFNNGYPRTNSANLDIQEHARQFYSRIPHETAISVTEYHGHWESMNYLFAGTLVKTGKADFLLLMQFPK